MILKNILQSAGLIFGICAISLGQNCPQDQAVSGVVSDSSGAVIQGASVILTGSKPRSIITGKDGLFAFSCAGSSYKIEVKANGFAGRAVSGRSPKSNIAVKLSVAELKQVMDVSDDDAANGLDQSATLSLDAKAIAGMADDPDDFKRQLQVLAASGGGVPGQAAIGVDGFQNGDFIPPKSAIASIQVSPDLYSAEYAKPPYQGGRVDILTKPGGPFEGSAFISEGPSFLSARDPYSQSATPASQNRYGFDLGGPIKRNKSDFFLAFEKRNINEFNVVNASSLDADGVATPFHQTVAAPSRLWIANLRNSWQLDTRNTLVLSYSGNLTTVGNQGVGGLVLPSAGYNNSTFEQSMRVSETAVLNANLLNQVRFSSTWTNLNNDPLSTDPGISVAGAFTGGGAAGGTTRDRQRALEFDDSLSWTTGSHFLKFGAYGSATFLNDRDLSLFNGTYLFAGQGALSGLQQYGGTLLNLPGIAPTSYEVIRGTPGVSVSQWQESFFVQDEWHVRPRLSVSLGLRYEFQSAPASYANLAPRAGIAWSPDRKQLWVIRAHAGVFYAPVDPSVLEQAYLLNGQARTETLVYSPSFVNPLLPAPGSIAVENIRQLASGLKQSPSVQAQIGVERRLPQHWLAQASVAYADASHLLLTRNINAPLLTNATQSNPLLDPRPIAPDLNIFQFEQSGTLHGAVGYASLSNHSYKNLLVYLGYLYFNLRTDADTPTLSPQSSYSNAGNMARASWEPANQVSLVSQVALPKGISLSTEITFSSGKPYDVLTGTDNNGDGNFNDRPSLAFQPGPGVYQTPFGLLSTYGVDGSLPRNAGIMPSTVHLDAGLSRSFNLPAHGASDRHHTLTVNLRAANILNYTNVTSVGNIVGSPTFGQPIAAETGRRVEAGLKFNF